MADAEAPQKSPLPDQEKRPSLKKKRVLICLAMVNLLLNVCISIMAPFFPDEARKKHKIHKGEFGVATGLVFSTATISDFLTAPLVARQIPVVGPRLTLGLGMILVAGVTILFGTVDRLYTWPMFLAYCYSLRIVQGIGTAMVFTSSFAILASTFPDAVATVSGTLEVFSGLGFVVGPALGGWLYSEGGFRLPFYVVGGVLLVGTLVVFILPAEFTQTKERKVPLSTLLRQPRVVLMLVTTSVSACCLGFFDPTLGPFLKRFKLSPSKVGLCFLIGGGVYTVFAPFVGYFSDKYSTRPFIPAGLLISAVAYELLGPSPIFLVHPRLWLSLSSLALVGLGIALAMVPISADILDTMHRTGVQESLELHSSVGGLLGSAISLGEGLGPTLGGALSGILSFDQATGVFGGFLALLFVVVTVFAFGDACLSKYRQWKVSKDLAQSAKLIDEHTPLIQEVHMPVDSTGILWHSTGTSNLS